MSLSETLWTPKQHAAVKDIIYGVAFGLRDIYERQIPSDVAVVGNDWVLAARVMYGEQSELPYGTSYPVRVESRFVLNTSDYQPLGEIFRFLDAEKFSSHPTFAVIAASSKRTAEIEKLGRRLRRGDDWFDVRYADSSKIIRVCLPLLE